MWAKPIQQHLGLGTERQPQQSVENIYLVYCRPSQHIILENCVRKLSSSEESNAEPREANLPNSPTKRFRQKTKNKPRTRTHSH